MAQDPTQQPAAGPNDAQKKEDQARVQKAFALGWHMAELYHFDNIELEEEEARKLKEAAARTVQGASHDPDEVKHRRKRAAKPSTEPAHDAAVAAGGTAAQQASTAASPTPPPETTPPPEAPTESLPPTPPAGAQDRIAETLPKRQHRPPHHPTVGLTIEQQTDQALRDALPGVGELVSLQRRSLLLRQVKHDVKALWEGVDTPSLPALTDSIDQAWTGDVAEFHNAVGQIHDQILAATTVVDFRLGKSYGLGRALAETAVLPCRIASAKGVASEARKEERDEIEGVALQRALEWMFRGGRVYTIQAWLLDLRDWFSPHAADAVSTTLGGWGFWLVRPTIGQDDDVEWNNSHDRTRITNALRRQGDMWRGLLSGEKNPDDIVSADYYFLAMASVVRRIAHLAVRFLSTGIGLLSFLVVLVAFIALVVAARAQSTTGLLGATVALLTSLGVTTGSVTASVKNAWSKAETPLWQAEVSQAIAQAAWQNPAPLGSVQQIQLLLEVGETAGDEMSARRLETRVRHPRLYWLRTLPVGRIAIVLIVATTAAAVYLADGGLLNRDASFFVPPLAIVAFLALIDGWDLLIGLASRQRAPYLALPESIALPAWIAPAVPWLAPIVLAIGVLAGHFFWH